MIGFANDPSRSIFLENLEKSKNICKGGTKGNKIFNFELGTKIAFELRIIGIFRIIETICTVNDNELSRFCQIPVRITNYQDFRIT